jgi:hypothetical protein
MTKSKIKELKTNEKYLYNCMRNTEKHLIFNFGMDKYGDIQNHPHLSRARKNWLNAYDLLKKHNLKPYVK